VLISNRLGGQALPAEPMVRYITFVSRADTAWSALEDVAAGLSLSERFHQAVARPSANTSRRTMPRSG